MDLQKIKFIRKKSGFTQKSIAEKINVSRDTIVNLENGEGRIVIKTLEDYLQVIDLQLTVSIKN